MSVEINSTYDGQLRCTATHTPSGVRLVTDAPVDNMGRGQSFSPTDLVATALATCMATTMAIVGQREGIELTGMTVRVVKEMTAVPTRRIAVLRTQIVVPLAVTQVQRQKLENAAHACPVHKSLHPEIQLPVTFEWLAEKI